MANLTGDFDVVAQFAVPAINRVLAAMHSIERFPHSMSMRVDDTPRHGLDPHTSVIGVRDVFGDATTDPGRIRNPRPINLGDFLPGSAESAMASALGAVANIDISDIQVEPIQPSHLKGKAQLQLFPPTIEINDTTGTRVTVRIEMMSRYLPDPGTPPVAQFIRGDLRITADVNQVVWQNLNVVSVNVQASTAVISFTPKWSSSPISAQDLAAITQLIRNAIRTSFLPSNATLDSSASIRFRTTTGTHGGVSVLINMEGNPGNPATANQNLLSGADGFAFGIGQDYVKRVFATTLGEILQNQIDPIVIPIYLVFTTYHITYTITLHSADIELKNGKIVLIVRGHAHTGSTLAPNFDFTLKQDLSLSVFGSTVMLVVGDFSIDTDDWVANRFRPLMRPKFRVARDDALAASGVETMVMQKFSAEENLGDFLGSLLTPANSPVPVPPLELILLYTNAEIRETGIILHGVANVPSWPIPRVEFETITPVPDASNPVPPTTAGAGPDYTALRTWIPGGTVQRYEWHRPNVTGHSEENRFVFLHQGPVIAAPALALVAGWLVPGYSPMCLTVHGTLLSASGAVTSGPVSMTTCGFRSFPVGGLGAHLGNIVLTRMGAGGKTDIVGHASATPSSEASAAPNLVIHFADERSVDKLPELSRAVRESGRKDAPTAIVVAATASQIERLPFSDDFTYAEDDAKWRQQFDIGERGSATVVVDPSGKVLWRSEGDIDARELSAVLGKVLVRNSMSNATMVTANVRRGQPAPDFLFEHAPGQVLALRKVAGRAVDIVFFRKSSPASVEAVREAASNGKLVLAVTDDEASKDGLSPAVVVHDRHGDIQKAYGIRAWPTIVSIDESRIVRGISYGRSSPARKDQSA
jgi:hypothetical protein